MITVKDLKFAFSATKREIFERLFPDGAEITVENARRATGAGLSLRCAATQLMRPKRLERFQQDATRLLDLYRENTAETRTAVAALAPYAQNLKWMDADIVHSENKAKHWGGYLDGLAKAFVEGMAAPSSDSSCRFRRNMLPR